MANTAALIRESIWRNREFRALPRGAQCTYLQLCSQKDLDCAGLLTLNVGLLAKGCNEIDTDTIRGDLKILEDERFVFVDEETDELFVRAYMRTAEVVRSPNIFKSALKSARHVESPKLRAEVASELRRLHRAEADRTADELNPCEIPRPNQTNPSETLPEIETLPKPSSTGTSTDTGTRSPSVGGSVGERPPRPECRNHNENSDTRCHACMRRRKWDEAHAAQAEADELERKRAAKSAALQDRRDCPLCDDDGWLLSPDGTPVEPATRCTQEHTRA